MFKTLRKTTKIIQLKYITSKQTKKKTNLLSTINPIEGKKGKEKKWLKTKEQRIVLI